MIITYINNITSTKEIKDIYTNNSSATSTERDIKRIFKNFI